MLSLPNVPWDVAAVELDGDGQTILLARVWLDVLASAGVDREQVRAELAAVCGRHPAAAVLAAGIARPGHVRALPAAEQARWLVAQVRAGAGELGR